MAKERDMRPAVDAWLRAQGCQIVKHEGGPHNANCDLVGARFAERNGRAIPPAELIAVELKLTRIAEVVRQAVSNREWAVNSYAAMPDEFCRQMRNTSIFKFADAGVGLLAVDGDNVVMLVVSARCPLEGGMQSGLIRKYVKGLWRRHGPLPWTGE